MFASAGEPAGRSSFVEAMPEHMNHFAQAKGATTTQIQGEGPFAMTYVNPSDDPRNRK